MLKLILLLCACVMAYYDEVQSGSLKVFTGISMSGITGTLGTITQITDAQCIIPSCYVYYAPSGYEGYDTVNINGIPQFIAIYSPCSSLKTYSSGVNMYNAIPDPQVSMSNNNFDVVLSYMRENITYQVSMCDTDMSCGTTLQSSYSEFSSAPTATFPNAMSYPPYNIGNLNWNITPSSCSSVRLKSNMTYRQLLSCKQGSLYCVNIVPGPGYTDYIGSIYIKAYRNGNIIQKWTYGFLQRFTTIGVIISQGTVKVSDTSFIVYQFLDVSNYLHIHITSNTIIPGYITNPITDSSKLIPVTIDTSTSSVQIWEWKSTSIPASGIYSDILSFSWTLALTGESVNLQVQESMSIPILLTSNNSRPIILAIRNITDASSPDLIDGTYSPLSPIYVVSTYQGSEPVQLTIINAWICHPINPGITIIYDPMNSLYACTKPSILIPSSNIDTVINSTKIVTSTSFSVNITNTYVSGYPSVILSVLYPGIYTGINYFQVEIQIDYIRTARSVRSYIYKSEKGISFTRVNMTYMSSIPPILSPMITPYGLSSGAIVGIILGSIASIIVIMAIITIIVIVIVFVVSRNRRGKSAGIITMNDIGNLDINDIDIDVAHHDIDVIDADIITS